MTQQIALIPFSLIFIAGMGISLLNHAGLWWTVRRLPSSRRPVSLSIISFYVRMGLIVTVFYFALKFGWQSLLACLTGFIVVRLIITNVMKSQGRVPA